MSACVPHILLAEDNRDLAMVLGFNLKRGGFQVTTVYSGRQAWEAAQNQLRRDTAGPDVGALQRTRRAWITVGTQFCSQNS